MRRWYLFLLAASILAACGGSDGRFKLEGNFRGINQGELYVYTTDGSYKLDTIALAKGEFQYRRVLDDTVTLVIVFPNFSELPVFAEPGATVKIEGDATHLKETKIKGTKLNEEMTTFRLQTSQLTPPEVVKTANLYINDHPASPISVYLLNRYFIMSPEADYDQAQQLATVVSQAQPENEQLKRLVSKLSGLKALKDGGKLPAFTATDIQGRSVSSADLNARVNVIYVWASWNYESISLQNQLQRIQDRAGDKEVKVLGISVDGGVKACRRIIDRDSIKWSVVCDGRMWESPLLEKIGLTRLPDNIVIDSQGKILGHGLDHQKLVQKIEEM